ncbi:ankyrin repeat domain-containing protein 54-like isoform X2 [Gigantopelta aegis]|uniref:ankyrin repeat domain-containing protein 54-like isoform X2 n=1 Tax=Gigantopelta aegis TaxID=1735272 RepID=UPI001B88E0C2|nr:ankyrin repeat domain-containing protein 54-like isoform X2 [Gigantopelta aegis]
MNESTADSDCDTSSSEGEYNVSSFESPHFEFAHWSPEPPAGLHFMCLVPFNRGYTCNQDSHVGKIRTSSTHRKQRLKEFKSGKTTGRNILDDRKLRTAACENNCSVVVELLESGVDPSSGDAKERTALHFAASQGYETIVKILLDHGADVNKKDVLGNTPLHLAACTCQVHVVTLLLRAGTDVKSMDKYGRTPLSLAKSRLNFLSQDKNASSEQLKKEVQDLSEMMSTYLSLSGMQDDSQQLDQLCEQLQQTTTRDEVDAISNLLYNFTNMTIQKEQQHPS